MASAVIRPRCDAERTNRDFFRGSMGLPCTSTCTAEAAASERTAELRRLVGLDLLIGPGCPPRPLMAPLRRAPLVVALLLLLARPPSAAAGGFAPSTGEDDAQQPIASHTHSDALTAAAHGLLTERRPARQSCTCVRVGVREGGGRYRRTDRLDFKANTKNRTHAIAGAMNAPVRYNAQSRWQSVSEEERRRGKAVSIIFSPPNPTTVTAVALRQPLPVRRVV